MNNEMLGWVWENSPLKGSQLLVHLALAADASSSGYCWSTTAHVAEQARTSYMTAKNAIQTLIGEDLLQTEQMYGHKNVFHLLTPSKQRAGSRRCRAALDCPVASRLSYGRSAPRPRGQWLAPNVRRSRRRTGSSYH